MTLTIEQVHEAILEAFCTNKDLNCVAMVYPDKQSTDELLELMVNGATEQELNAKVWNSLKHKETQVVRVIKPTYNDNDDES
jgi:hypothetical protein